jgi:hypothetical protein
MGWRKELDGFCFGWQRKNFIERADADIVVKALEGIFDGCVNLMRWRIGRVFDV